MKFTDEDLKRLKNSLPKDHDFVAHIPSLELEAILARLDAAEKLSETRRIFISLTQDDFDSSDGDGYIIREMMDDEEKTWKESKGEK